MIKGTEKQVLMKDVVKASVDGDKITLTNIIGESKSISGKLIEVNLLGHTLSITES